MTPRVLMTGILALLAASILSILAVQYFAPADNAKSTNPPDPLVVAPDKAAEETK